MAAVTGVPAIPAAKIHIPPEDRVEILKQIDEVLESGQLTLGKYNRHLEAEFARIHESPYAVAVSSGTSALEIALRHFKVEGREVLVPTNTFFATAAAVMHAGGRPRFVDVDPATFSIDLQSIQASVTPDTAGVIVVHIAGIVTPQIRAIRDFCREHGLFLLEDAAHAHGCAYDDQMAGTFGDAGTFSFYPTKVITAGEGGMIVTADEQLYKDALKFRDQGKEGFLTNFHTRLGNNWRLSEPHAIIGIWQLRRLSQFIAKRREIAAYYDEALQGVAGIKPVPVPEGSFSNYYKYLTVVDPGVDRASLKAELKAKFGVSLSGEVYETPLHLQPIFAEFAAGDFTRAEDLCARHVCLPLYATMTEAESEHVVSALRAVLGHR